MRSRGGLRIGAYGAPRAAIRAFAPGAAAVNAGRVRHAGAATASGTTSTAGATAIHPPSSAAPAPTATVGRPTLRSNAGASPAAKGKSQRERDHEPSHAQHGARAPDARQVAPVRTIRGSWVLGILEFIERWPATDQVSVMQARLASTEKAKLGERQEQLFKLVGRAPSSGFGPRYMQMLEDFAARTKAGRAAGIEAGSDGRPRSLATGPRLGVEASHRGGQVDRSHGRGHGRKWAAIRDCAHGEARGEKSVLGLPRTLVGPRDANSLGPGDGRRCRRSSLSLLR